MPAMQKEILLPFFLGSPISVLNALDYMYKSDELTSSLLNDIGNKNV